jgi:hypothetical protein
LRGKYPAGTPGRISGTAAGRFSPPELAQPVSIAKHASTATHANRVKQFFVMHPIFLVSYSFHPIETQDKK